MECEISEPFEIKPEADSTDISECDDKPSIGRLLLFDAVFSAVSCLLLLFSVSYMCIVVALFSVCEK